MAQWINGKVVGKHHWTTQLLTLQFAAEIAPFKAGQFVQLGLDIDGQRIGRPYSLINTPDERPHEIYFNIVAGGHLSPYLAALDVGDCLWLHDQANGFLTLDEVPEVADLWMLSSGTGLGPFISMLKTAQLWQRFEHVVLAHAVRSADELSYQQTIGQALHNYPEQFRFVPFVSREQVPQTIHSRIPASIKDHQLEDTAGLTLDATRAHVMLCGNTGMITDTIKVLAERGLKRHRRSEPGHITTEKYF